MKCLVAVLCIMLVPAALLADYTPTTVYEIQQGAFAIFDDVEVDSVVVTNVDRKPTTYGFHVQEQDGGPYSGILVYAGSNLPTVEIGDLVRVWGYFDEYRNHSEIQISSSPDGGYEIIQEDFGAPACTLLSCVDIGDSAVVDTLAEKWEGVYICVDTVMVLEVGAFGDFTYEEAHVHPGDGMGTYARVDDKCVMPTLPMPAPGDTVVLIRGTFAEEYDTYRIWPRTAADVIYLHGSPPPSVIAAYPTSSTSMEVVFDMPMDELSAENEDNYSLESGIPIISATLELTDTLAVTLVTGTQATALRDSIIVCDVQSVIGEPMSECQKLGFRGGVTSISQVQTPTDTTDASPMDGERVTITGIIVHADSCFNGPFFIQEKAGGPWNGIYVYVFPTVPYDVGDSVVVSGFVQEYYNWTEIVGVDYVEWAGTGVSFNGPALVTPGQIKTGALTAESYESVFIQMDSVETFSGPDSVGEWKCGIVADTVAIGDLTCAYNPCYDAPCVGTWARVTGPIRFNFAEFKVEPRGSYDVVGLSGEMAGVKTDGKFPLKLAQNAPNPFTGETVLKFSVPRKMNVKMSIYDISGRLVKTVADGDVDAGEHTVTWDGKDSFRRDVSPGIYFVRMATPERAFQKKMVLLQ